MSKEALIKIEKKTKATEREEKIIFNSSLLSELNEYAKFAKVPGRQVKEKRHKLIIAMIEKVLADDEAFAEYKADKKKAAAALRKESKVNVKAAKKDLIGNNELAATLEEEVQAEKH